MEAVGSVLRAGDRLDRYELLCPIASGGMATVWLARLRGKRGFEKLFAIKTIRTELLEDSRFQEMFLDEARIASGIQHPNVAQILDLGEQKDVLFIVMEWIDGDSLAKIRRLAAKSGRLLPMGPALRIVADACAGLHAAHELRDELGEPLGIVHRDVSPQNILVSTGGAVKVIDFGIAKAQNRKQGETRTGIVKGKVQYMAPEQVKKGRSVDRRADVWALGVCLHELVAGRLPNDGDDDVEVIRRLLADEAPNCAEGLPQAVAAVLERSVTLSPDERFPTAGAMQRAIESAMKDLGESATGDDVATFLRVSLPELAERRRTFVSQAVSESRERSPRHEEGREEVAFAPTVIGDRRSSHPASEEARAIALTKRKSARAVPARSGQVDESGVVPSPAADEPLKIPKRSRAGLWIGLALSAAAGAMAAVGWAPTFRVHVHDEGPPDATLAAAPSSRRDSASPGTPAVPAILSVPTPAAAAPVAKSNAPVRPQLRAIAEPQESRSSASAWAFGVAASADAESIGAAASASAGVDASVTTAIEAGAGPIDTAPEDDPNNPYNAPSSPAADP